MINKCVSINSHCTWLLCYVQRSIPCTVPCSHVSHLSLSLFLQFEPVVHPESAAHVHHMDMYVCNDLDTELDRLTPKQLAGGPCQNSPTAIKRCTGRTIIAAWAVGGQVLINSMLPAVLLYTCMSSYSTRNVMNCV